MARPPPRAGPREGASVLHWFSLRFQDAGQEAGFVKTRSSRLVANMRKVAGVIWFAITIELVIWEVWDLSPDRYETVEQMRINQRSNLTFGIMWLECIAFLVLTSSPCLFQKVPPALMEAIATLAISLTMCVFVFATPHYAGRSMGYDTNEHLEDRQLNDTFALIGVDTLLTAAHILLPIRFHLMLLIQGTGILCYALPALLLGSPHPANVPHTLILFVVLVGLTGFGKHSIELHERTQFLDLIAEKRLRVESEFELAAYKERGRRHSGTEDQRSVHSASKASTNGFGLGGDGLSFEVLTQIGLKEQWLIREEEVRLLNARPLGEGGFGIVVRGKYHGAHVAVKAPKKASGYHKQDCFLEATCNELRILRRLQHPNIVVLYGAVLNSAAGGGQLCLVLELIEGEPLKAFMARCSEKDELSLPSSEALRVRVLVHINAALCYLHSRQPVVVHGDLKSTNIFVSQTCDRTVRAKLLDFGLSRLVKGSASPMGGTLRWAAPEVLSGQQAPATTTDMFSFGRIVFFVSTGLVPYSQVPDRLLRRSVLRSSDMEWPPGAEGDLARWCRPLAEECTAPRPQLRPSAAGVCPVLAGMDREYSTSTTTSPTLPPREHGQRALDGFAFASEELVSTTVSHASNMSLEVVPEGEPLRESGRLVHGSYRPTPHETLAKAVGFLLMQSNHEVTADAACCWLHCGLHRLKAVCRDMQSIECDGWDVPVDGQCKDCGLLFIDGGEAPRTCSFCRGDVSFVAGSGLPKPASKSSLSDTGAS